MSPRRIPIPVLGALRIRARRAGSSAIVLCVAFALVVYGLSGSLLSMLGAQHQHSAPPPTAFGATWTWSTPTREPAGKMEFEDFRRLSPSVHAHSHSHSDLERHHHDRGDSTVVVLGGDVQGAHASDEGSPSAAPHLLAVASLSAASMPEQSSTHWARAHPAAIEPWIAEKMERPPKA